MPIKLTKSIFIERANRLHNKFYDYSLVEYKNCKTKVTIICYNHGKFKQTPSSHLNGSGCKICGYEKISDKLSLTTKEFINKAKVIHNNKYDYSLVDYKHHALDIKIICNIHGEFKQTPNNHLEGKGCKKCAMLKRGIAHTLTTKEFINKAKVIHNNKYDYSLVDYKNCKDKIKIICPTHGIFEKDPDHFLNYKQGCQKCNANVSKPELEICNFLKENSIKYIQSNRIIIKPYELDIVIPQFKLAIEFCGQYWHSEQKLKINNNNNSYHKLKYELCKKNGYQLLTIFEYEWLVKKEIVKSIILAKCNSYINKIGARNCNIKEIDKFSADIFLNNNHIQGFNRSSMYIGLFYNDNLVSVVSFSKYKSSYNLTRFATKKNYLVHGAFSKLLKYFIKNYNYNTIFTFADKRISNGDLYYKTGFNYVHDVEPSYYYFKKNKLELLHKRNFQHKRLQLKFINYNPRLTEYQNCLNNGYDRIWDCGKLKFELV